MSAPADLPDNPSPPRGDSGQNLRRVDRRRLLQGGLAAAPILMTLVSRPVLGQTTCTTLSRMGSGNTSSPGKQVVACSGFTPTYWKQETHFSSWPSPYVPMTLKGIGDSKATKFHPCFSGRQCQDKTLLEVLDPATGAASELARYIVAALLNAQAGKTPVLTVANVKTIWSECSAKGYYEISAGVKCYPNEIVAYLKTTMPG